MSADIIILLYFIPAANRLFTFNSNGVKIKILTFRIMVVNNVR